MNDGRLRQIVEAVSEAADHALTLWAGGNTQVRQWEKTVGQPVCDADIAVNTMLRTSLTRILPDAAWLSEETVDDPARLSAERLWVVDPIDGTRDYLAGKRGWAVSVALVEHGLPVIGILAAPARNELWMARADAGAQRNGTTLRASERRMLSGARVPADILPNIDGDLTRVEKPNSIALRMGMVAADEADLLATIRWGNEWDIAASTLIAQEAGARVTDVLGGALRFNRPQPTAFGVLCCAPAIHQDAMERLGDRARAILGPQR